MKSMLRPSLKDDGAAQFVAGARVRNAGLSTMPVMIDDQL
jgi:hypothetical protein